MAVYLEHLDLEELHDSLQFKYDITSDSDVELVKSYIVETYGDDDTLSVPSCMCGKVTNAFRIGVMCDCGTACADKGDILQPFLWMQSNPEFGLPFISPSIWSSINDSISNSFDTLRYISDTTYNPTIKNRIVRTITGKIMALDGYERSYTWLINNLSGLLQMLNMSSLINKSDRGGLGIIIDLIDKEPRKVFTTRMPLPGRELYVMISKGGFKKAHIDPTVMTHDIAFTYMNKCNDENGQNRLMVKLCSKLSALANENIVKFLAGKYTLTRKHVYGTRLDFTMRGTIVPIVGKHKYYETHVPWCISLVLFKPHLMNLLLKHKNIPYIKSNQMLIDYIRTYNSDIDEMLQLLISGSKDKRGIPIGWQRAPSLLAGSWISTFITKFKTDVKDETIGKSDMITSFSNADFDGDQMHGTLYVDNMMAKEFATMEAHHSFMSSNECTVSNMVTLGKPTVVNISNAIRTLDIESK